MIDRMKAPRPHRPPVAAAPVAATVALAALIGSLPAPPGEPGARLLAAKPKAPEKVRVQSVGETSVKLRWRDRARGERRYEAPAPPPGNGRVGDRDAEAQLDEVRQSRARAGDGPRAPGPCLREAGVLEMVAGAHPGDAAGALQRSASRPPVRRPPPGDAFNQDVSGPAGRPPLRLLHRPDQLGRRRHAAPGLRLQPRLRDPLRGRAGQPAAGADRLRRLRRRERPRPLPGPARRPDRGRRRDGDRHVLVVERPDEPGGPARSTSSSRRVSRRAPPNRWTAGSGAVFDLGSQPLPQRPEGWTSADAAGLPIFPGLVRYEEVAAGAIDHAIRITFAETQSGYMLPRHPPRLVEPQPQPPADGAAAAPRRLVIRHRAASAAHALVILEALQALRDDRRRQRLELVHQRLHRPALGRRDLNQLKDVPGTAFEVVDTGEPIRPAGAPCAG